MKVKGIIQVKGDFSGGLQASITSLPQSIAYGIIAFAPLGEAYLSIGALAGLYSSIVLGFVTALMGGTKIMISGSRATAAIIVNGLLAYFVSATDIIQTHGTEFLLGIVFCVTAVSGLLQVIFSLLRLGIIGRFFPRPVLVGFVNASAILILISQISKLLDLSIPNKSIKQITDGKFKVRIKS